ncbi:MAG: hypothetical protein AABW80_03770 [Nanoarchaeota archaeon]
MKLKFCIKDNKKIYTLQERIKDRETLPAHYKFIKIKDVKPTSSVESLI